jgi:transposase
MSHAATTSDCPQCAVMRAKIAELEARLAKLEKNSTNSSKPPSSDFVDPAKAAKEKRKKRRRAGGQPGHAKHERTAFQESELDRVWDYVYERCPDCDGKVTLLDKPSSVVQQIELAPQPIVISEHRGRACYCAHCRKTFVAPVPPEVRKAGLVGTRLTTLVAYLKGACHCSFTTIRKYLRDVLEVTISRGQLRRVCAKVTQSLNACYEELLGALPDAERLNVDETGHPENGQRLWTWCFRAPLFTLFKIDPSRGSDVLLETLGVEFEGVLGCDYFSAYRKYMRLNEKVVVQFCLAHLIRDVKFLTEHPDARNRSYGRRLQEALRNLFGVIHRRAKYASPETFDAALGRRGVEVLQAAQSRVPSTSEALALAKRFDDHGFEYLQFVMTPGIEPTNNLAEQAIRFVVIDRHITQGSRSAAGRRWLERIWTTIATCAQHGKSVFEFLAASVKAYLAGAPPPTLLFNPPRCEN